MKILVVSHSSVVETHQGKLRELSQYPDIEVHLIIPHAWPENNRWIVADSRDDLPYQIHIIPAYRLGKIASYFYTPFVFQKTVRHIRPDIMYAEEEPWSVAAWQCARAARRVNAKLFFFTWENIERKYKWISEIFLKTVLEKSSAAVVGNGEGRNVLHRRGYRKPITVLPQYGVDMLDQDIAPDVQHNLEKLERPIISYFGRIEREKGIDLILHAASNLRGQWSLLIVGDGEMKENLKKMAEQLRIENRMLFHPAVPHEKVREWLSAIDILVLPSRTTPTWKEQFGRILIEAMAIGIPVVGSDSGAIPEVIDDAGVVIPEEDVEALRKALQRLIDSEVERKRLSHAGRLRVSHNYSNQIISEKLYSFLNGVIKNSIGVHRVEAEAAKV